MVKRRVDDSEKHIHFVTFSCFKRRKHLQHDQTKRIVIGTMGSRLAHQQGCCLRFVIMPVHVHALVWFPEINQLSPFFEEHIDVHIVVWKPAEPSPRHLEWSRSNTNATGRAKFNVALPRRVAFKFMKQGNLKSPTLLRISGLAAS